MAMQSKTKKAIEVREYYYELEQVIDQYKEYIIKGLEEKKQEMVMIILNLLSRNQKMVKNGIIKMIMIFIGSTIHLIQCF